MAQIPNTKRVKACPGGPEADDDAKSSSSSPSGQNKAGPAGAGPQESDTTSIEEGTLTYLSIVYESEQVGLAAFNPDMSKLLIGSIPCLFSEIDIVLQTVKFQTDASTILISSKTMRLHEGLILNLLRKPTTTDDASTTYDVRVLKSSMYDYVKSCCRLEKIQIGTINHSGSSARDKFRYLNGFFDLEEKVSIMALGGLLAYIEEANVVNQLERRGADLHISSVEKFCPNNTVAIDAIAAQSLGIFDVEAHPSQIKGVGRSKEGLSLYGLLDRTYTASGRKMLKLWLLRPLRDPINIIKRQDGIQFCLEPNSGDTISSIVKELKKIRNLELLLVRIKKVMATSRDWLALYETVCSVCRIWNVLYTEIQERQVPDIFTRLLSISTFQQMQNILGTILDTQTSSDLTIVKAGVSPELDLQRSKYSNLENYLTQAAVELLSTDTRLNSATVEYIPLLGFLLRTTADDEPPEGYELQFEHLKERYWKCSLCRKMDTTEGDVFGTIKDIQQEIMRQLEDLILQYEMDIHEAVDVISEIDCVIALAACASDYSYTRPQIVEDSFLYVEKGRHPLQELLVETFIPNDTSMSTAGEQPRSINIITGPNGSGKSIYLKQIGIIVIMAHIGSFVPAKKAIIGLTDRIFCRIQSIESVALAQSTFTIDVTQMATILRQCTPKSLILVDEFGKGTEVEDGIGLLAASILQLAQGKAGFGEEKGCPRVVITTNVLEIFEYGLLEEYLIDDSRSLPIHDADRRNIFPLKMDIMLSRLQEDASAGAFAAGDIVPLYVARPGIATSCNGIQCAQLAGIPDCVISRAVQVRQCLDNGVPIPASTLTKEQTNRKEMEEKVLSIFTRIEDWGSASLAEVNTLMRALRGINS